VVFNLVRRTISPSYNSGKERGRSEVVVQATAHISRPAATREPSGNLYSKILTFLLKLKSLLNLKPLVYKPLPAFNPRQQTFGSTRHELSARIAGLRTLL
jgi:hypothetical protein